MSTGAKQLTHREREGQTESDNQITIGKSDRNIECQTDRKKEYKMAPLHLLQIYSKST